MADNEGKELVQKLDTDTSLNRLRLAVMVDEAKRLLRGDDTDILNEFDSLFDRKEG